MKPDPHNSPSLRFGTTSPVFDIFLRRDLSIILGIVVGLSLVVGLIVFWSIDDLGQGRLAILGWVAGSMLLALAFAALLLLAILRSTYRNGIIRAFELSDQEVRFAYGSEVNDSPSKLEAAVAAAGALTGNVHWAGFMAQAKHNRSLAWKDVKRFAQDDARLVISLYRGPLPAMRIYCPDQAVYEQALGWARQYVSPDGKTL